ncbi:MAG: DegT/DnrJ/EryC1/StrS family aminotransferase [Fimbriimonadaceae bacterium]|nr:DegT/DnrJ/EryC1/StrS family aminotransferase [Fimbriimonadaceae bacterium]
MAGERAAYGAAAVAGQVGALPNPFPRPLGPRAAELVGEVLAAGLASDMVGRFERAFAAALGVRHCIATPGCTPALATLFAGFDGVPGDEVVVSGVSDYGAIQGLCHAGYLPVFADVAPGGLNVSAATLAACLSERTRALLVVHKTGLLCDMAPIQELAQAHGLRLIEDCCQAVFSRSGEQYAGTFGDVAAFSFDSEKTMGSDVGGCLVTNDDALAERLRFWGQSRGAVQRPGFGREHQVPGHAYRMTQTTAALCLAQLDVIHEHVARRDQMARRITALLGGIDGVEPLVILASTSVWSAWMLGFALTPGAFDCDADQFAAELVAAGLNGAGTARYYLLPAACTFLQRDAAAGRYPYSQPPASRQVEYGAQNCPQAAAYLDRFIRWSTFCEKYEPAHCELVATLVAQVAAAHRRKS